MRLQLRIYAPREHAVQIGYLFGTQFITFGSLVTDTSDMIEEFLQIEIDGQQPLMHDQWSYLAKFRYHLTFLQPYHEISEEEGKLLDDLVIMKQKG